MANESTYLQTGNITIENRTIYSKIVSDNFPIQLNGGIDWKNVNEKYQVTSYDKIVSTLKEVLGDFNEKVFIIWDGANLPPIRANLLKTIEKIDDVTAVGFDTWVISPYDRFVIEFYHEGGVTIGTY